MRKIFILLCICMISALSAEEYPDDKMLLKLMRSNYENIEDYQVTINVSVSVPGLRMPRKEIQYYFKAPDKSKIDASGFAMVPREGVTPFFQFINDDSIRVKVIGDTLLVDYQVFIVELELPEIDEEGGHLDNTELKLWVDQKNGLIHRGILRSGNIDFITAMFRYQRIDGLAWLPSETIVELQFPPEFRNIQMFGKDPVDAKKYRDSLQDIDNLVNGNVELEFSDYKLNRGLPDKLFEDEETEKAQ